MRCVEYAIVWDNEEQLVTSLGHAVDLAREASKTGEGAIVIVYRKRPNEIHRQAVHTFYKGEERALWKTN